MRAAPPDKRLRFIQEEEEETSGGNVEVQVHHIDAKEHHGTNKNGRDGEGGKEEESEKLLPSTSALSPKRPPRPRPLQMPKEDIDFVLAWNGRSEREASEVEPKTSPFPTL